MLSLRAQFNISEKSPLGECGNILYHYYSIIAFPNKALLQRSYFLITGHGLYFFSLNGSVCQLNKMRGFCTAGCTAAVCCSPTDSSKSFYARRNRKLADSFALAELIALTRAVILCQ